MRFLVEEAFCWLLLGVMFAAVLTVFVLMITVLI